MSSRRKSRPVRRLDHCLDRLHARNIDNALQSSTIKNDVISNSAFFQQELPETFHSTKLNDEENTEDPPEGVFILQPQSASDDDEGHAAGSVADEVMKIPDTGSIGVLLKKRLLNETSFHSNGFTKKQKEDGLDLCIKRKKNDVIGENLDDNLENEAMSDCQNTLKRRMKEYSQSGSLSSLEEVCNGFDGASFSTTINGTAQNNQLMDVSQLTLSNVSSLSSLAAIMASLSQDNDTQADSYSTEIASLSNIQPKKILPASSLTNQYSSNQVDTITAGTVSSGVGSIKKGTLDPTNFDEEVFDQYITKFSARNSCKQPSCPYLNKDHYHCIDSDCNFQRFTSKSDVIRHYNLHKKRDNALAHGFMRFSPSDDCSLHFGPCHLKGTSTHYHCLHNNCNKVYTSTSDVMTHENFHKKNLKLGGSGFHRYRSTEYCNIESCSFRNQRVTHFHCTRSGCSYAVRNKSEMEKHKSYHMRNDSYARQGFKKFYKNELCHFPSCPWNRLSNHFHCLRNGCSYSFISTSQMVSHKRKHDQQEETVTDKANAVTSVSNSPINLKMETVSSISKGSSPVPSSPSILSRQESPVETDPPATPLCHENEKLLTTNHTSSFDKSCDVNQGKKIESSRASEKAKNVSPINQADAHHLHISDRHDDTNTSGSETQKLINVTKQTFSALKYFRSRLAGDCKLPNCVFFDQLHFHCVVQDCCAVFVDKSLVFDHTMFHERLESLGIEQTISSSFDSSKSAAVDSTQSPLPPGFIALSSSRKPLPDLVQKENCINNPYPQQITSDVGKFDRFTNINNSNQVNMIQVPQFQNVKSVSVTPTEGKTFFNFKSVNTLPLAQSKNANSSSGSIVLIPVKQNQLQFLSESVGSQPKENESSTDPGYIQIKSGISCAQSDCKYRLQNHWHCTLNRCRYVCKSLAKAQSHRETHDNLEAYAQRSKECFRSYSGKKICPYPNCEYRYRGHYHCIKPGCQFATIGSSKLPWHMKKHEKIARREASGFKYHTKNDHCGKPGCKYSGSFSHYHCVRPGCSFVFQYKHQMTTHIRKHLRKMLGTSFKASGLSSDYQGSLEAVDLPVSAETIEGDGSKNGIDKIVENKQVDHMEDGIKTPAEEGLTPQQREVLDKIAGGMLNASAQEMESPLNGASKSEVDQETSLDREKPVDFSAITSGLADSDNIMVSNSMNQQSCSEKGFSDDTKLVQNDAAEEKAVSECGVETAAPASGTQHLFSKFRLSKDVLDGFKRFEVVENCGISECVHNGKATHYHCLADGCHYRFTGRTHMQKHKQHHERVSNLVRDDFKRVKLSQKCDVPGCTSSQISTHFHCLRCDFMCTDTTKVGSHRRVHMKADMLQESGFEGFSGKKDCGKEYCKYRGKNMSHLHCTEPGCLYSVLGFNGIQQHAMRHKNIKEEQQSSQINFSLITQPIIAQDADSITSSSGYTSPKSNPVNTFRMALMDPVSNASEQTSAAIASSILTSLQKRFPSNQEGENV